MIHYTGNGGLFLSLHLTFEIFPDISTWLIFSSSSKTWQSTSMLNIFIYFMLLPSLIFYCYTFRLHFYKIQKRNNENENNEIIWTFCYFKNWQTIQFLKVEFIMEIEK